MMMTTEQQQQQKAKTTTSVTDSSTSTNVTDVEMVAGAIAAAENPPTTRTRKKKKKNDDDNNDTPDATTSRRTSRRTSSSSQSFPSSSGREDSSGSFWVCSTCTYHNPMTNKRRRCQMCNGRRSVSDQTVVVVATNDDGIAADGAGTGGSSSFVVDNNDNNNERQQTAVKGVGGGDNNCSSNNNSNDTCNNTNNDNQNQNHQQEDRTRKRKRSASPLTLFPPPPPALAADEAASIKEEEEQQEESTKAEGDHTIIRNDDPAGTGGGGGRSSTTTNNLAVGGVTANNTNQVELLSKVVDDPHQPTKQTSSNDDGQLQSSSSPPPAAAAAAAAARTSSSSTSKTMTDVEHDEKKNGSSSVDDDNTTTTTTPIRSCFSQAAEDTVAASQSSSSSQEEDTGGFNYGFNYTPPSQTQSQSQSQSQSQRSSTHDDDDDIFVADQHDEVEQQQQQQQQEGTEIRTKESNVEFPLSPGTSSLSSRLKGITRNLLLLDDDLDNSYTTTTTTTTHKPPAAAHAAEEELELAIVAAGTTTNGEEEASTILSRSSMAQAQLQPQMHPHSGGSDNEIAVNKNEDEMFDDDGTTNNPTLGLGLPSSEKSKAGGIVTTPDVTFASSLEHSDWKEEKKSDEAAPSSKAMAMFQTAGSRTMISVSEEGMIRANNLFSESTSNSTTMKPPTSTNSRNKNRYNTQTPSDPAASAKNHASIPTSSLFQTAGPKKTIFVTEKGMAKANDVFCTATIDKPLSSNVGMSNSIKRDRPASTAAMFQTAGLKKTILVTEKGKMKANDLFADAITPATLPAPNLLHDQVAGPGETSATFQTAGLNKTIAVSEMGKKKANEMFADNTNTLSLARNLSSTPVAMFQTAGSKKSIRVTIDQMEKAQSLLAVNKTSSSPSQSSETSTSRARSLGTAKAKSTQIDCRTPSMNSTINSTRPGNTYTLSKSSMPQSIGFTVAGSSRQIEVSEEDIRRASVIFEDSSSSPSGKSSRTTFQTHTATKKSESASSGSASAAMPQSQLATNSSCSLPAMFQTAGSNTTITVAEDSMARASKVLQSTLDVKQSSFAPPEKDPKKPFDDSVLASDWRSSLTSASFHTAGRKTSISVSKESIDRATRLFNSDHENKISLAPPDPKAQSDKTKKQGSELDGLNSSPGVESSTTNRESKRTFPNIMFQTAGTKTTVKITKQSLARAEEMFNLSDFDQNRTNVQGYNRSQTDVFTSSSDRFSEQPNTGQQNTTKIAASHTRGGFDGFKVAGSGNEIKVSEEKMQQAAQLLEADSLLLSSEQEDEEYPNRFSPSRDDAEGTQGVTNDDGKNLVINESSSHASTSPSTPQVVFCVAGSSKAIHVHEDSLDQARLLLDAPVGRTDTDGSTLNDSVQNTPSQLSSFQSTPSIKQTHGKQIGNDVDRNHAESTDTPMPSTAGGVRFGTVQRATYGLSPLPLKHEPVCSHLNTDIEQAQLLHQENGNIEFTPKDCGLPKRSACVTISTDEVNAIRKRDDGSTNPLTPVSINFTNPGSELNDFERNTRNNSDCLQSSANRCTNLEDAINKGEMTSSRETSLKDGVNEIVLSVNSENAYQVRFDTSSQTPNCFSNDSSTMKFLGAIDDYRQDLMKFGCDENKLKDSWITNHTRWIVWKLASYERKFSKFLAGKNLTYQNVVCQLQYRYKQEITEGLRSPLRKILNRDIAASKMMIVTVCRTIHRPGTTTEPAQGNFLKTLEVSDGWYSVKANLDEVLSEYVDKGLIKPGTKLLVSNARLIGEEEGVDPLDTGDGTSCDECGASLTMFANATRIAKWNAKLGFVAATNSDCAHGGFLVVKRISDITSRGGRVPVIRLFVRRVYQLMYLETVDTDQAGSNKTHVFLTQQEEDKRKMEFERKYSQRADKLSEVLMAGIVKVGSKLLIFFVCVVTKYSNVLTTFAF